MAQKKPDPQVGVVESLEALQPAAQVEEGQLELQLKEVYCIVLLDNGGGVLGTTPEADTFPTPDFIKLVLQAAIAAHGKQVTAKIDKRFILA